MLPVSCGQFAHVYVPGKTLRRPISICDASENVLRLVYQVKGEGTKIMSQMQPGYMVDVLVPLGNGFKIEQGRRCCLIGGGIGAPPMLYTAKQCDDPLIITGFRNESLVILQDEFKAEGETLLVSPVAPVEANMLRVESTGSLDAEGTLLLRSDSYAQGGCGGLRRIQQAVSDLA